MPMRSMVAADTARLEKARRKICSNCVSRPPMPSFSKLRPFSLNSAGALATPFCPWTCHASRRFSACLPGPLLAGQLAALVPQTGHEGCAAEGHSCSSAGDHATVGQAAGGLTLMLVWLGAS